MKVLFLSRWYPYPVNNGSKIRVFNLIKGLSGRHPVGLISFYEESDGEPALLPMQQICQEVQVIRRKNFDPGSLRALMGFFSLKPRAYIDAYSSEMGEVIRKSILAHRYDCIIASQVDMAAYADLFAGIPSIFEEAELAVLYDRFAGAETAAAKLRHWLTWSKHRRFIKSLLEQFALATVVSERERGLLAQIASQGVAIEVIPNFIDLNAYAGIKAEPKVDSLIFMGSFNYQPNYQGMVWFQEKVYPRLKASNPSLSLTITGAHGNRPLPNTQDVNLTGYLDDIRPSLASSWCSIVPLHSGGGTRLKILEAMALRTPVVATTKGAEGLEVVAGEHILLADDPQQFAEAVESILKSSNLRQKLAENAYNLVREKYDWSVVMPRFITLLEGAVG